MRTQPARRRAARAAYLLSLALVAAALLVASVAPRAARAQRSAIDTYAITNARIVTVSGAEIPRGTIVIRNGLIAAVGANVAAPADARVIDGTGLTVYPGLIDANTNLGMPASQQRPGGGGGAAAAFLAAQQTATPAVSSPNSSQPVGLQPEILASDVV
ncbi:MAG TPA: hypothetical protein VER76_15310, partial [Pyrinomonadaceae bacterium]|nr:hypothetical protein [Pyrinomonadaceae bacterium]